MVETIRVLIADDHPLVRCGIREILRAAADIVLVGEASRGEEAQRLCRELQPDVLLLDLQMPGAAAVDTIMFVHTHCAQTRIIVLTAYDDEVYVRRMLAEGVAGYILKDDVTQTIVAAMRTVRQGGSCLSERVMKKVATLAPLQSTDEIKIHLTKRERQLLDAITKGWNTRRIAEELSLAEQTVRHYLSSLYAKIGVVSRQEAIIWAMQHGFALW